MNCALKSSPFWRTHLTKEELLHLITVISTQLKKLNKAQNASTRRFATAITSTSRRDLVFEVFLNLIKLYKVANRMVSIDGSQINLKCLLASARQLFIFFIDVFTKLDPNQIEAVFDEFYIARKLTQHDVEVTATWRMISNAAIGHHKHQVEVRRACQEQKGFRESFLKTHTDFDIDVEDQEAEQNTQLLSIEEAVLIIQKLERKYQAISRRNYVRFVRERAAELHGQKTEIDATHAAIRIQARTRGFFARKLVREMREKELNILNMTPESYIRKRCAERVRKREEGPGEGCRVEKIEQVEEFPLDLENALELLKDQFFFSTTNLPEPTISNPKPAQPTSEAVYRDACFRGIVSPLSQIEIHELTSQRERCTIENRHFRFDLRTFLTLTVCIPLSLATWPNSKDHRTSDKNIQNSWLLLSGSSTSGKTTWARAIAKACHIAHVHISKNVVNMGKQGIYGVTRKLAKHEKQLLISIDKIDLLRKDLKPERYRHRQILLRNFLSDLSKMKSIMVIGMTDASPEDLDNSILDLFPLQAVLSTLRESTRYDLAVDCLSRNWEQERLPKFPHRIFDIEKQTEGFSRGKTAKFVTNRWSAANNKTNLS